MGIVSLLEWRIANVWQELKRSIDKPCPVACYVGFVRDYSLIPQEGRFSGFPTHHLGKHRYKEDIDNM